MRGTIISFDQNRGLISGQDGNRYNFMRLDWSGKGEPYVGAEVDFIEHGNSAKSIFLLQSNNNPDTVSILVLALACAVFGVFGLHRFVVGKVGTGLLMLVLTCTAIGMFITVVWTLIDFIVIVMGNFTDKNGHKFAHSGI